MNKLFITISVMVHLQLLYSQDAVVGAGGNANLASGSVSYSIGQLAVESFSNAMTSISPGVQQPFEIYEIVGTSDQVFTAPISIYPNPTSGDITLQIDGQDILRDQFSLSIFDAQGRAIRQLSINNSTNNIDIHDINTGIYIFRITNSSNQFRTFKIIKK